MIRCLFRLLRVRICSGSSFKGFPFIRVGGNGSSIFIGKGFTAISRSRDTPLGVSHRVIIRTVASGAKIVIGDNVGLSGCTIVATKSITIGNRVMIGSGAMIFDSDFHPLEPLMRVNDPWNKGVCRPIVIEDDVFIGARAMILKGVRIGKGAVVGAGAVVTKDVPAGATVVGNPARIVHSGGGHV